MMNPRLVDSFIGMVAPAIGLITSMQEQLEYWLRVGSLVMGLVVASVSLHRLIFKHRK